MNSAKQSMRLFIAAPISEQVSAELAYWAKLQKEHVAFRKWTHPSDYHITLQFLGDTSEEQAEVLKNNLKTIQASSVSLALGEAGFFGLPKSPRVLWSAVLGDINGLHSLQQAVVQATSQLGFEAEKRPYVPHVTIARSYNGKKDFNENILQTMPSQLSWKVDHFILMKTNMNASPMYENIGSFALK